MNFAKIIITSIIFLESYLNLVTPVRASDYVTAADKRISRVIALTSLSADIVNYLSNESLVGIPGSSLLKKNNAYTSKKIISSGRMPPNLEKILKLKPDLVIGSAGFHQKTLKNINKLGIETLSVSINNFDDLEKLFSNIKLKLSENSNLNLKNIIPYCYKQRNRSNAVKNNQILVLVSSKPLLSPNSKSWAGNMINRFGLINLTSNLDSKSQFKGYVNLSPEWVLKSKASKLITIKTPGSNDNQYKQMSIWSDLEAVKTKKVYEFDYYGLINPGSLNSINTACDKLLSIQI